MEFGGVRRRERILRIEGKRKSQSTELCGNHCCGDSLATTDKKIAAAKINRIIRLRWLTQRNAPGILECRAEI